MFTVLRVSELEPGDDAKRSDHLVGMEVRILPRVRPLPV
jgi:hypothetical protein